MRWSIFALAAYVALALQVGLAQNLAIGYARPDVILVLAVFIALSAPPRVAVAACGVLGLLLDAVASPYVLLPQEAVVGEAAAVTVLGPYALGYMAGGYLVVQLRPMLFRQHPLTLAAMVLVAGAELHLIVLGLLWVRQWYEPMEGFVASDELIPRGLGLLYTAIVAMILAYPLAWAAPLLAFQPGKGSGRSAGRP